MALIIYPEGSPLIFARPGGFAVYGQSQILELRILGSALLVQAEVAQSVEQGTENPRVGSSILSLGTK